MKQSCLGDSYCPPTPPPLEPERALNTNVDLCRHIGMLPVSQLGSLPRADSIRGLRQPRQAGMPSILSYYAMSLTERPKMPTGIKTATG
jgi:hypothetical protein